MTMINNMYPVTGMASMQPMAAAGRMRSNDGDGDDGGSNAIKGPSNNLSSALGQTMGQMGLSSSTSATAIQDPQAALQNFMQTLMASLNNSISAQKSSPDNDNDGGRSKYNTAAAPTDLQSIVKQLASTGSSANSNLQQSYQNLLSSLGSGANGSSSSLSSFLQTLSSNVGGASSTGFGLNVKA
ncbi:MAG: hypothetical protein Q9M31_09680 [Mariprofundus sp.]|nr:hypothetical protein [Mariprofundus sp.]